MKNKKTKIGACNKIYGLLRTRDYQITSLVIKTVHGLVETVTKSLSVNYVYSAYNVKRNGDIKNHQCLKQLRKLEYCGVIKKQKGFVQGYQFLLTDKTKDIIRSIELEEPNK